MLGRHAFAGVRFVPRAGRNPERPVSRRRPRRGWGLEVLEGRALLSVYLVDSPGDAGVGVGPVGDVRYAIEQADESTADSTILFAPNLYGRQITLSQGVLAINKPSGTLTIEGPGADVLAISGGGSGQVFSVSPTSQVTISGLTMTDGVGAQGGGIQNNGTLTLSACTISGNTALGGGGGGVMNGPFGRLTIGGSTISGNESTIGYGGGIANKGTLTIGESTISGNQVVAGSGGGIANSASLTLADDTVSDNSATAFGGGIVNLATVKATISMDNTVVADDVSAGYPDTADIADTDDVGGSRLTGSNDLVGTGDVGTLASTLVGVDPQLGPLQDNGGPTWTQAIPPGSPAAGAGDPALVPSGVTYDQRGVGYARIVQGQLDIGAYEIQPFRPAIQPAPAPSSPVSAPLQIIIGLTVVPAETSHGTGTAAPGGGAATSGG